MGIFLTFTIRGRPNAYHDLRNPFNTIIGFSELLLNDLDSFEKKEVENQLKQILRAGEQTYNLLEDLLMWANSQSGKMAARLEEVDAREVCLNAKELLEDQADRKQIKIDCCSRESVWVKADRFMLTTVIRNLLSNAIKFTEQGGNVTLSISRKQGEAIISVADTGWGIEEENLQKLWDITGQTSRAGTDNEQGSGLGLLLCKEFVEKQGGKITVQSQVGKGSIFEFTVSLAR